MKLSRNIALILGAMFFVGDRFLKLAFYNNYLSSPRAIIGDWLQFNFVPNRFIAFSLPLAGLSLDVVLSLIIIGLIAYLLYLIPNKETDDLEFVGLTFLILGAISNLMDRFRFGFVIDYLDFKYFTILNIADVLITFGVGILIYQIYVKRS